jgi:Brp/Blh family beta-carotene 15,15'-monooxygenase
MTVLPPVFGFALYFCLLHSPRHFSGALQTLSWHRVGQWIAVVAPLTLAALGLAAVIYRLELRPSISDQIVAASFMTLAVVTVPHMLVPRLVDLIDAASRRRSNRARALRPV